MKMKKAESYSQIELAKPYIAVGMEYYIELRMTELIMCKSIRFTYYCEELFVVKHKSAHGVVLVPSSMIWDPKL